MKQNVNVKYIPFHCTFESCYTAVDNVIIEQLEMLSYCPQLAVDNSIVILSCTNRMRNILVGKRNQNFNWNNTF